MASEVEDDMFDNWDDEGFGDYDSDFGEEQQPEVSVAKCHGSHGYICVKIWPKLEN